MKPAAFDYVSAETLDEALAALAEYGEDAAILAGGLSLGAMMNMRLARPEAIIDINRLPDLDRLERQNGWLRTGALLRQADAMESEDIAAQVPLLHLALPNVGHYQTRSRGTLAGSVAHADPSAEIPLCLATLGGEVMLASSRGQRAVPARDFAEAALITIRQADEMVTALRWPTDDGASGVAFAEINQRHGDFAIVAAAAWARVDDSGRSVAYALGLGGVEDRPRVTSGTETFDVSSLDELAQSAATEFADELHAMQDPRVSAAYRQHLARHLGGSMLRQALTRSHEAVAT